MNLPQLPVTQLVDQIQSRKISAQELLQEVSAAVKRDNPVINAFVALDFDAAMESAKAVDRKISAKEPAGRLAGIPFGVKDLEDLKGFRTTKGCTLFQDTPIASTDSVMVGRLRAQGGIPIGKTNTPEFGWKGDTSNPLYGATLNPIDLARSPGGSSGGSAAAVASGMVPFATGSDGGGSIRIPAALCGLSGFKTTLGRIPAFASTAPNWGELSVVGPLTRRLADTAYILDELCLADEHDFRSLGAPRGYFHQFATLAEAPRRVLVSLSLGYAPVDSEVECALWAAVEEITRAGVEVVISESVFSRDPVSDWTTLTALYTRRTLLRTVSEREFVHLDEGLSTMIAKAGSLGVQDLLAAQDACHLFNLELVRALEGFDALITPTVSSLAPLSGRPGTIDGKESNNWVRFTYPFNMTRSPAATVNIASSEGGLPIGMQIVGHIWDDLRLMGYASFFEKLFFSV